MNRTGRPAQAEPNGRLTILVFSHLRWTGVYQRPQQILSRLAERHDVMVWEECVEDRSLSVPELRVTTCAKSGVTILTPAMPDFEEIDRRQRQLLDEHLAGDEQRLVRWYYTPMMLPFSAHLDAACTVYDCMDELSAFRGAPREMALREAALFKIADLVFAGGPSIYAAKKLRHDNAHLFRSSVDVDHFAKSRALRSPDFSGASTVGYCGVIDERLDLELIAALADQRPDLQIEMAGPVAKISPQALPQRPNVRWLGKVDYDRLPDLMSKWHAALMPFALNEATRFISPTKTPEYLAAGLPVVTTPIRDVVEDYGSLAGVRISAAAGFARACDDALALFGSPDLWLDQADAMLMKNSWARTVTEMEQLVFDVVRGQQPAVGIPAIRECYDVVVVGAGFAGSVMAERLANGSGKRVLVIDRRDHIGGNAFDCLDDAGVLIHRYGPHIFHTNSEEIFSYLSRFTGWRPYEHRVLAAVDGQLVPMPINRTTLNLLYSLSLETEEEAADFLASRAEPVEVIRTSEDVVVSAIGRHLYEKFFRGYTRKQWALDPSELDKSVTSRVPTRTNTDDRYFTDRFQAMPKDGYTRMFERMLDNPLIDIRLGTDFAELRDTVDFDHLVYTGPIDAYFHYRYGRLPYRSLRFDHRTLDQEQFQQVATVNYPDEAVPYTRITEYKHLTGQRAPKTSVTYEYPQAEGDPYYPIPRAENKMLYKRYQALADREADVTFVGRLATYQYYNMDQVVGQALAAYATLVRAEEARRVVVPVNEEAAALAD